MNKGIKLDKAKHLNGNKINKKDIAAMRLAYQTKKEEYEKLTLDEMKAIWADKTIRPGGSHKLAFLDVTSKKLQELAVLNESKEQKDEQSNTSSEQSE